MPVPLPVTCGGDESAEFLRQSEDFLIVGAYLAAVILQILPVSPFYTLIVVVPVIFALGY